MVAKWEKYYGDWMEVIDEVVDAFQPHPLEGDASAYIVDTYDGDGKNPPNVVIEVDGSDSRNTESKAESIGEILKDWGMFVDVNRNEVYAEPYP
tara:strand:- start:7285 stop:7566 length:282 start_codon:yes stop_codon:yes gene_type:complete